MIGKPIEAPDVEEPTVLGAAILAGIGTGLYKDPAHAYRRVRKPAKTYTPDLALTDKYHRLFETFQKLHPALREVNASLRANTD
jgi:xylulokinase